MGKTERKIIGLVLVPSLIALILLSGTWFVSRSSHQTPEGSADAGQIEAAKSVYFVLDCGDDDFLFKANVATYQLMKKNGMNVQFRCYDGAHASYYWYDALRRALVYMTRHFSEQMK